MKNTYVPDHTLLSKPLRIQTDKSLSTQGSITSPKNNPPHIFKTLDGLSSTTAAALRNNDYIPRDAELFSSTQYLTELGQDICG